MSIVLSKNNDEYFKVGTGKEILGTIRKDIAETKLIPKANLEQIAEAIKKRMDELLIARKRHCFVKMFEKDPEWAVLTCHISITPKEEWWL